MTIQATGSHPFGANQNKLSQSNITTHALDANNDGAATFLRLQGGKTVTHIGIRVSAVAGTLPTYRASLQGITSRGTPDGTVLGGGSPASTTFNATEITGAGWFWLELDNTYAVAAGGVDAAVVIDYSSGTVDGSNNMTIWGAVSSDISNGKTLPTPYIYLNTAGTWAAASATRRLSPIAVRYSDGSIHEYTINNTAFTSVSWNSGSGNIERGITVNSPVGFRLCGIEGLFNAGSDAATYDILVYLGASGTPEFTLSVDPAKLHSGTGGAAWVVIPFDEVTVAADQDCHIVIKPTTANNLAMYTQDFTDATERARMYPTITYTVGSAGTWTPDTAKVASIVPLASGIDLPAGGGGFSIGPGKLIRS